MKQVFVLIISILAPLLVCGQNGWKDLAVTENSEFYIDSTNVKMIDGRIYATVKTVYTTAESRQTYVDKIKRVFRKNAEKKIRKWDNFSYSVTYGLYDCTRKRFKILEVKDYTGDDKLIIQTKSKEEKSPWLLVDSETVGDFVLFFICDQNI
ncbi:surface-adhesin E family protein [Dysgonomonas alginatilytica]|nr:surface-adhesin E family protein [Dysgonomonas alginatilytica]